MTSGHSGPPVMEAPPPPSAKPSVGGAFNPFIYGSDVDSVDVATRVAMVKKKKKN
jgi:hypothetical protein